MCILGKIGQFGWLAFMMTVVVFVLLVVVTSAMFNKRLNKEAEEDMWYEIFLRYSECGSYQSD